MPADNRTYITVHDGMPDHPKVDALSDRGFRALVGLWCWCARNLTDGVVKGPTWAKRAPGKVGAELISAGLADVLADGDVYMHDYLEHQRSKAQVDDLKNKRRDAGAKGGRAKAERVASATANAQHPGGNDLPYTETETDPSPSGEGELIPSPAAPSRTREPHGFAAFYDQYPRKVGRDDAAKAYTKALRRATSAHILLGARRLALDPNLPGKQFIPHPATWLNRGGWDDEPLPAPELGRPAPLDRLAATVALGEQMQADHDRAQIGAR